MKQRIFPLFIVLIPFLLSAQSSRKSWYGNIGVGYGSYKVDIHNYNGGSSTYADQKFTAPLAWLGFEKKSIIQKSNFVLDAGAELVGGFSLTTKSTQSGPTSAERQGGWLIGIHALAKAGYMLDGDKGTIVPLLGVGPYFTSIQTKPDTDEDEYSSQLYGVQGYAGIDFRLNKITLTPQLHIGIASWGNSDKPIGKADNTQNGQPSMLEAGIKAAIHL